MAKITNVQIAKTEYGRMSSCDLRVTEDRCGKLDCLVAIVSVRLPVYVDADLDFGSLPGPVSFEMEGETVSLSDLLSLTPFFNESCYEDLINKLVFWETR